MAPRRDSRGRFVAQSVVAQDRPTEEERDRQEGPVVSNEHAPASSLEPQREFLLGGDFRRRCRQLLGTRRTAELLNRAGELQGMVRNWTREDLQAERQQWGDPLASVDRAAASETLMAERRGGSAGSLVQQRLRSEGRHLDQWGLAEHAVIPELGSVRNHEAVARVLALEGAYQEQQRARDRQTVIAAIKRGEVRDPFDAYRPFLGTEVSEALAQRASYYAQSLEAALHKADPTGRKHNDLLWSWLRETAGAFAELDRETAQEVLDIEGERWWLETKLNEAEAATGEEVSELRDELARLNVRDERLRQSNRHPRGWWKNHGEQAAQWLTLRRELVIRSEIAKVAAAREAGKARDPDAPVSPEMSPAEPAMDPGGAAIGA